MASLPNTIIFDILQNSNKTDFPEIRKTNETWHHLLQNILDRREKNSVAISPRRHIVKYFFWNEATDEHFKDLSEEQQKKLGALHIGDFTQKSLNDDVFTLHSICEKSPKREHDFKVQFPKLVISSSIWEMINHLSTFFPVDFEEIEVAKSLLTNMCSLRPSVKKLTIFDSMIFPDVVAQLSDFLQTMTWETVELLHVEADGDLQFEELIVKAWIGTKQPQLKSYTSDIGQPGLWKRFITKMSPLGKMPEEGRLVIKHSTLKKSICLTVKEYHDEEKALDMERLIIQGSLYGTTHYSRPAIKELADGEIAEAKDKSRAVDAKDAFSATAEKKNDEEAPPQRRNSKRPARKSSDRRYIDRLFDPTLAAPPNRRRPQDKPEGRPSPIRPPPKSDRRSPGSTSSRRSPRHYDLHRRGPHHDSDRQELRRPRH
ncbi:hypothetical protein QR680_003869 [Steinernema hermaphroditum]|uniref:F-box domain-containing protein n=1 Tax=Steinernema hermaphroditum TaxID=289476 RepID=A0AA39HMX5_9BILA|nr:hypothetical protein QR680_003869 [Steinernema hermaphroditum]